MKEEDQDGQGKAREINCGCTRVSCLRIEETKAFVNLGS